MKMRLPAYCATFVKNTYMIESPVKEGKIELFSTIDGFFTIDIARLHAINSLDEIMIATRTSHVPVKKGDKLAGMRVIPLVISKTKMAEATRIAGNTPILQVLPYQKKKMCYCHNRK